MYILHYSGYKIWGKKFYSHWIIKIQKKTTKNRPMIEEQWFCCDLSLYSLWFGEDNNNYLLSSKSWSRQKWPPHQLRNCPRTCPRFSNTLTDRYYDEPPNWWAGWISTVIFIFWKMIMSAKPLDPCHIILFLYSST